jgi:predicted SAM-dependent methyltransferase
MDPDLDMPAVRYVLNAGCGANTPSSLHAVFRNSLWEETRLDLDRAVAPDIIGSLTDLSAISDASFDAIWCSHSLEHLHGHDVPNALSEFRRVLQPDGFALITTPDLEAIAELVVSGRLEDVAYTSPAGPITALDMIFGHAASIQQGSHYMAHNTGFTADRMGHLLIDCGFTEALVIRGKFFDLWGLALMPMADKQGLLQGFRGTGLDFYSEG